MAQVETKLKGIHLYVVDSISEQSEGTLNIVGKKLEIVMQGECLSTLMETYIPGKAISNR